MKKILSACLAIALTMSASISFALPQNLPHHNSGDVSDTVKVFIPYNQFSLTVADTSGLRSFGAGTPYVSEINSLGVGGLRVDATGDDVHILMPIPSNACVDCPIKFSILWSTNSTTTTQTATWKVLYSRAALGAAISAASTALNTVITSDAVDDTAYGLNETPQGILNASTLSRNDIIHVLAEIDAVSGLNPASDVVFIHGIYMEYVRQKL